MLCVSRCQALSAVAGASGDVTVAVCPGFRANVALQMIVRTYDSGRDRQSSEPTARGGADVMCTGTSVTPRDLQAEGETRRSCRSFRFSGSG